MGSRRSRKLDGGRPLCSRARHGSSLSCSRRACAPRSPRRPGRAAEEYFRFVASAVQHFRYECVAERLSSSAPYAPSPPWAAQDCPLCASSEPLTSAPRRPSAIAGVYGFLRYCGVLRYEEPHFPHRRSCPFRHKHDAIDRSPARTSENYPSETVWKIGMGPEMSVLEPSRRGKRASIVRCLLPRTRG